MKLKKVLLVTLFLLPTLIQAQSEQLQREIRIAEGILQELFQENLNAESPLFAFNNNKVSSDYIPGYGVHFILGNSLWSGYLSHARGIHFVQRSNNSSVSFEVDDEPNNNGVSESVTLEELEERMMEYMAQYASLLRNLPKDEYIRLSTGMRSSGTNILVSRNQGSRNVEIPKITMWVKKSDLLEFERGEISENQFIQKIQSADLSDVSEKRDFNIFKSILDTSVQEADFKQINIRSASSYTYLPGFGIQFNLNANARGSGGFNFSFAPNGISDMDLEFDINDDSINKMREELEQDIDSIRIVSRNTLDSLHLAIEDLAGSVRSAFTVDREPIDPELLESDKKLLYDEITRSIREYGSTLSTLPADEFIIVSINWSARESTLPERTYIRLKKNELSSGRAPDIQEVARR